MQHLTSADMSVPVPMCVEKCTDCVDVCTEMCIAMYTGIYVGMCVDMCVDMCIDRWHDFPGRQLGLGPQLTFRWHGAAHMFTRTHTCMHVHTSAIMCPCALQTCPMRAA